MQITDYILAVFCNQFALDFNILSILENLYLIQN